MSQASDMCSKAVDKSVMLIILTKSYLGGRDKKPTKN